MNASPAVSVMIVNWNALEFLRACLASLANQTIPLEILVVDNASQDASIEMVRSEFPQVQLIASEKNLGFAKGNNVAAVRARGRYLFLLNPDTTVPAETLSALVTYADAQPQCGAVGPALQNPDGSRQRSCWRSYPGLGMALADAFYLWKMPWLPFASQSEFRPEELSQPRPVAHLLGACMLIRRTAWEQVGALDENYFLFLEETDWCFRAQRAGWQIMYYPHAHVIHYGQQSMRQAPRKNIPQFYSSYLRFYRSAHGPSYTGVLVLKSIIALACLIRMGMWRERAVRARDATAQELARAMTSGYQQTLSDLRSL